MDRKAGCSRAIRWRGRRCDGESIPLVPAVPLVPPCVVQPYARTQGHLGHHKTWYHSQVERQRRRRRHMVVGIIAYEMTLDREMEDAQKPATRETMADHQAASG